MSFYGRTFMRGPRGYGLTAHVAKKATKALFRRASVVGAGAIGAGIASKLKTKQALRGKANKTKKPSIFHKAIEAGALGTKSSFYKTFPKHKFLRKFEKMLPPQFLSGNGTTQITASLGLQNIANVTSYYKPSDILNQFNLFYSSSESGSNRIFLDSLDSKITLYNAENTTTCVNIYDIVFRKDSSNSQINNPANTIVQGTTDTANTASTDYKDIGYSIFTNPRFTEFYKVEKVTTLYLQAGETHTHSVHIKPHRVIDHEGDLWTTYGHGGLTRFVMVVLSGATLVSDSSDTTKISTSPCTLNCMYEYKYTFHALASTTQNTEMVNTLPPAFTGSTEFMNIYTEAVANITHS